MDQLYDIAIVGGACRLCIGEINGREACRVIVLEREKEFRIG